MRQRCERQDYELQKSAKKVQEAMALAADESAKSKAAKEVIKSLTAQVCTMLSYYTYNNPFLCCKITSMGMLLVI